MDKKEIFNQHYFEEYSDTCAYCGCNQEDTKSWEPCPRTWSNENLYKELQEVKSLCKDLLNKITCNKEDYYNMKIFEAQENYVTSFFTNTTKEEE